MTDKEIEELAGTIVMRLINSKGEAWGDILIEELKKVLR